ncbi:DUF2934 domain-containing protein [Azospirillum sp. sgz302134]
MDEHRIRERAYEIWEREGRPEGRHAEHWDQACRELQNTASGAEAMDANAAMPGGAGNLGRAAADIGAIETRPGQRGAEERAPGAREEAGGGA